MIDDCYALNVSGEAAHIYAYSSFDIVSVTGDSATDWGQAPEHGAKALMVEGDRAVLIGGYGPLYDLITPLAVTPSGVTQSGPRRRLALPDGLEVSNATFTCRGPDLHVIIGASWYRIGLEELGS